MSHPLHPYGTTPNEADAAYFETAFTAAPSEAGAVGVGLTLLTPEQRAHIRQLAKAATPGPWAYRPDSFDDWGTVRGGTGGALVAFGRAGQRRPAVSDDEHRLAGTDPYGHNAAYIAAVSPDVALGTLAYVEQLEAAAATLRQQLAEAQARLTRLDEAAFDSRIDDFQADILNNRLQELEERHLADKARLAEAQSARQADLDKWGDYEHRLRNELQRTLSEGQEELVKALAEAQGRAEKAEARVEELSQQEVKEIERTEYWKSQHLYLVGRVGKLEKRFHTPVEEAHIADMQEVLMEYWEETRPNYMAGPRQDLEMKRHNDYFNQKAIQYTGKPLFDVPAPTGCGVEREQEGGANA